MMIRKRRFQIAVWLLWVLVLAACGGDDQNKEKESGAAPAEGTLTVVQDHVEIRAGGGDTWAQASGVQTFGNEDAVHTDASGRAFLTFFTGTEVEILPNSELVVARFEQTDDGGYTITLNQLGGETLHRVERIADREDRYVVETPSATIVVRGTEFGVEVKPDGATYVEVREGVVQAQVGQQTVEISAGEAIDISAGQTIPGTPYPIPVIRPPSSTPIPTSAPDTGSKSGDAAGLAVPPPGSIPGQIAFVSDREGDPQIYVMNADGTELQRVSDQGGATPAWSSDGDQIVFQSNRDNFPDVYVMNADGSDPARISQQTGILPTWSPDGDTIAFLSLRGDGLQIYLMNTNGEDVRELTSYSVADSAPAWSPDAEQIAFAMETDGIRQIYVLEVDRPQREPIQLTDFGAEAIYPAWSPDGAQIVFYAFDAADTNLYVMDADGGNVRRLLERAGNEMFPVWSPDGEWIAFVSDAGGSLDIYVMRADGSDVYQLTDNPADDTAPAWKPESQGR